MSIDLTHVTPFLPADAVTLLAEFLTDLAEQGRAVRAVQYHRLGLGLYAALLAMTHYSLSPSDDRYPFCLLVFSKWPSEDAVLQHVRWARSLDSLDPTAVLAG